ncbi:hypothetical protein [Leptospira noguchii]|uniref:hypothetical protein n=1 Tax=Leptospira noguchii TaxID=28182 RepID=UPI001FB61F5C|nr:hypothetical protein [Leptospira noguchii]UOG48271.1 hypothetical protein MAL00_14810 [Leptospira noguchii]UOG60039.1 hypothetical protein MAL07_14990 [Leptospira noguchii]
MSCHPKRGKAKAERSLWIALETQQNALYGSRWKLSRTLSMDRVLGRKFHGKIVVIPTDLF